MNPAEEITVGRHRHLDDSDDSDDDNEQKNILTTAKAADLCPKDYRLIAKGQAFTALEDMSTLRSLDYIDLTNNALGSVEGLGANRRLKTLILRNNKLSNIGPILNLQGIRILNIAENQFATLEWLPRAKFASSLLVLVAGTNKLASLDGLSSLSSLQTLVISNNEIEDLKPVSRLTTLTKLSASNNIVRRIPDEFSNLHNLSELRLAHNRLAELPPQSVLVRLSSLKIVDVGHNRLTSFDHLSSLRTCLIHLSVKNNPASSKDNYQDSLRAMCPKLEVIDGQRVAGGRRKLRVNRQRLEAGFPLEPDRNFARPPPESHSAGQEKKRPRSEIEAFDTENDKGGIENRKSPEPEESREEEVEEKKGHDETVKKRKKVNPEPIDEGPVLEPTDFIQEAREKSLSLPSRINGAVKVNISAEPSHSKKKNRNSMSKKKRKNDGARPDERQDIFGTGGESKW